MKSKFGLLLGALESIFLYIGWWGTIFSGMTFPLSILSGIWELILPVASILLFSLGCLILGITLGILSPTGVRD
jgi:hypothetical protein